MKIFCGPENTAVLVGSDKQSRFVLYGQSLTEGDIPLGVSMFEFVRRHRLQPESIAWDLLSIALSVTAADVSVRRAVSTDGWTRQIDLTVAVAYPQLWNTVKTVIESQLQFLTTDIWVLEFVEGIYNFPETHASYAPREDCITLLSGGLDSLVGISDLVKLHGKTPIAVSQIVRGDKDRQELFASVMGGGLRHLAFNQLFHGMPEHSQRSRSFVFLAYAVLAATALHRYKVGESVNVYVCENGFISLNPPLTGMRLGSLSTRTTHPYFMSQFQRLLKDVGLNIILVNPYQLVTKGEMLKNACDQEFLQKFAHQANSCGRFTRNNYTHCGRCLPCLIRRAAFYSWGHLDETEYVYKDLSLLDDKHSAFDDVRSAAMAVREAQAEGTESWASSSLLSVEDNLIDSIAMLDRGIEEIGRFLSYARVL